MARRRKPGPDEELDPDELAERLEEENDSILRDGQSVRVSLFMRDGGINPNLTSTQRGKAIQQTEDQIARKFGLQDGLALHRPGFRRVTDAAALERTRQAYNDYDATDAVAYKQSKPAEHTGGSPDYTGAGAPNRGSGAPRQRQDAADAKRAAYEQYDREMAVAYLRGR